MFELKNKRLTVLAEMARPCKTAADIGTDHAHLPIELILSGKCDKIIACDIKTGPLKVAEKNISLQGLSDKITLRLGFGLEVLKTGECELITVAGMGGLLICDILERSQDVASAATQLVLQPNTCESDLRKFLFKNHYIVEDERGVKDGAHYYLAISCKKSRNEKEFEEYAESLEPFLTDCNVENYYFTGSIMPLRKNSDDIGYLMNLRNKAGRVLEGIALSGEELSEENCAKNMKYTALTEYLDRILK